MVRHHGSLKSLPAYLAVNVARSGPLGPRRYKRLLDPLVVLAGIITVLDEGMPRRHPGASLADQSLKIARTPNTKIQLKIEIRIENQLP